MPSLETAIPDKKKNGSASGTMEVIELSAEEDEELSPPTTTETEAKSQTETTSVSDTTSAATIKKTRVSICLYRHAWEN